MKKILLSCAIIYHLSAMLVLPNASSWIGRHWSNLFLVYANTLTINTPWTFFSPTPGPPMEIEYEIQDDSTESDGKVYYWPPRDSRDNRLLYSARYFVLQPYRVERLFVPWACRSFPRARRILLRVLTYPTPNMERVDLGDAYRGSDQPTSGESQSYECH